MDAGKQIYDGIFLRHSRGPSDASDIGATSRSNSLSGRLSGSYPDVEKMLNTSRDSSGMSSLADDTVTVEDAGWASDGSGDEEDEE